MALRAGRILRDMRKGGETKERLSGLLDMRSPLPGPSTREYTCMGVVEGVFNAMAHRAMRGRRAGLSSLLSGGRHTRHRDDRGELDAANGAGSGRAATMERKA